jgi:hypothetical protein
MCLPQLFIWPKSINSWFLQNLNYRKTKIPSNGFVFPFWLYFCSLFVFLDVASISMYLNQCLHSVSINLIMEHIRLIRPGKLCNKGIFFSITLFYLFMRFTSTQFLYQLQLFRFTSNYIKWTILGRNIGRKVRKRGEKGSQPFYKVWHS